MSSAGSSKARKSGPGPSGSRGSARLIVVGFDTATVDTVACAWRDGEVLHESRLGLSPRGRPLHSTGLLAEVERAATAAGGWEAVDLLAVGLGPGTFTGVRIGIATARGLAVSLGLPAQGICTLDALGRGIQEASSSVPSAGTAGKRNGSALAVLDGWRGEVFAALYGPAGERVWEPAVYRPAELAERVSQLGETPSVAGSGAVRFRQELTRDGVRIADDSDPVHRLAARHLCALAATAGEEDRDELAPIYLRPPDAERWRERDAFQKAQ
jgi:tRNA threonylcarbamoyladenosine biosynthesis protein TsaB